MNLKELSAALALLSLLIAVIGLVRFGIDWWTYCHSSNAGAASIALNYRGLGGASAAVVTFGFFLVLYLSRKH